MKTFAKSLVIIIAILLLVLTFALQPGRWTLCAGSFHNYNGEQPEHTTFLLDRWTGKVWYAAPKSMDHYITPDFKPVFIDKSRPSEGW
jgi:hypothetical protein